MARRGNPSPDTSGLKPFKPGQSGNPGGKTSEQKRIELENARLAMEARNKFLLALTTALDAPGADILEMMDAQALKLLKDSEDRGLGAPVQSHTSPDGSFAPSRIVIEAARDDRDNPASA